MDQTKTFCTGLVTVLFFISHTSSLSFATNSIEIYSLNSEISPVDSIFVSGFVSVDSFYKPVRLEVYDPNGEILYNPYVNFNEDGQFNWLFHPPQGKFDATGTYTIIASHENVAETSQIQFNVIEVEDKFTTTVKISESDSEISPETFFESNKLDYFIPLLIASLIVTAVIWMKAIKVVSKKKTSEA